MKNVLTIAGSDSGGGAGIQGDLKTFAAHRVFGLSVITAVTAQNTQGVFGISEIPSEMIAKQMEAVFNDIKIDAVKIGMVFKSRAIMTIAAKLKEYQAENVVFDPVMVAKGGASLLEKTALAVLVKELLPLVCLVTPNIPEAEIISGATIKTVQDMEIAARKIQALGARNVLVKGGHLANEATDILFDGKTVTLFPAPRLTGKNTHGTGCALSSAIAANLSRGLSLEKSVRSAKDYITTAIENGIGLGNGIGPVHHFYELYKKADV